MKWWAQSFLVGIPQIVVGYRDDDGIVSRLETIEVKQLRKDCDVRRMLTLFRTRRATIHLLSLGLLESKHLHEFLSAVSGVCERIDSSGI